VFALHATRHMRQVDSIKGDPIIRAHSDIAFTKAIVKARHPSSRRDLAPRSTPGMAFWHFELPTQLGLKRAKVERTKDDEHGPRPRGARGRGVTI